MRAVGSLYWQRAETGFMFLRMRWEAADEMQTRKIRVAVTTACFNVLLEKLREIHKRHFWRFVPADTANDCSCDSLRTWRRRASINNAQSNVKITCLVLWELCGIGFEATWVGQQVPEVLKDQTAFICRSDSPRYWNSFTWRLLPSFVTSRITCQTTLRHFPQDVKFVSHLSIWIFTLYCRVAYGQPSWAYCDILKACSAPREQTVCLSQVCIAK